MNVIQRELARTVRRIPFRRILRIALAAVLLVNPGLPWVGVRSARAQALPTRMAFQGRLTDAANNPITGTRNFDFALYDALTGGNLLWSESQASVAVANGVFAVHLGASVALTPDVFAGGAAYLKITVNGDPLTPRERLVSSPYAFNAHRLAGLSYSAFVSTDATAQTIQGDKTFAGTLSVPVVPTLAAHAASRAYVDAQVAGGGSGWTDDGSVVRTTTPGDNVLIQSTLTVSGNAFSVGGSTLAVASGFVGLGTANPAERLEIAGNLRLPGNSGSHITWGAAGQPRLVNSGNGTLDIYSNTFNPAPDIALAGNSGQTFTANAVAGANQDVFSLNNAPGDVASGRYLLKLQAGGVTKAGVLSGGGATFAEKVGIGTSAPSARLHVSSAAALASDAILQVSSGTSPGQELLVVKGDGKVGIGTTAPVARLQITEPSVSEQVRIGNGARDSLIIGSHLASSGALNWLGADSTGSGSSRVWYGSGSGSNKLYIEQSGNVGIGITNPQGRLEVRPVAADDYSLFISSQNGAQLLTVDKAGDVLIGNPSKHDLTADSDLLVKGNIIVDGKVIQHSGTESSFQDLAVAGSLTVSTLTVTGNAFSVGGSTLAVIDGKVGIGTASPSAKLTVAGNMISTGTFTLGDNLSLSGLDTMTVGYGGDPIANQSTGRIRFPGYNQNHGSIAWYPLGYAPGGVSAAQGSSFYITGGGNFPLSEYDFGPANLSVNGALELALKSATSKNKRILIFGDQEDAGSYAATDDTGRMFFEGQNVRHAFFLYRPKAATPRFYITGTGSQGGFDDAGMDLQVNGAGFFAKDTGIGTASPSAALHVSSAATAASTNIMLVSSGTVAGQELLVVKGDGKVGIGTTNPTARLHLSGTGALSSGIQVGSGGGMYAEDGSNWVHLTNQNGSPRLTLFDDYARADVHFIVEGSLRGGGGNTPLKIDTGLNVNAGNVGIGNSNPAARLWVQGSSADDYHLRVSSQDSAGTLLQVDKAGDVLIGNPAKHDLTSDSDLLVKGNIIVDGKVIQHSGTESSFQDLAVAGSLTVSTLTVTGNAFSVGGSTFVVQGGTVSIGPVVASPAKNAFNFGTDNTLKLGNPIAGGHYASIKVNDAGPVDFFTTSDARFLLDPGGSVSIGNAVGFGILRINNDWGEAGRFSTSAQDFIIENARGPNAGKLRLRTDSLDRVVLDAAGSMGIGTTSPTATLHVSSAATAAATNIVLVSTGTGTGQEVLAVKGDGKVGIGTTSPSSELEVRGTPVFRRNPGGGSLAVQNEAGFTFFQITSADDLLTLGNINTTLSLYARDSLAAGWQGGFTGSNVLKLLVKGAAGQTADLTQWQNSAGTVLGAVDASGKLGVGTATPGTSRLWVQGAAAEEYHLRVSSQDSTGALLLVDKAGDVLIGNPSKHDLTADSDLLVKGNIIVDGKLIQHTGTSSSFEDLSVAGSLTAGTMTVTGNAFSVGGSTFAVANGKLGIGTSDPAYGLDLSSGTLRKVYWSGAATRDYIIGSGSELDGTPHGSGGYKVFHRWGDGGYGNGGWSLVFGTAANPSLAINDGNVAVGANTAGTGAKLESNGAAGSTGSQTLLRLHEPADPSVAEARGADLSLRRWKTSDADAHTALDFRLAEINADNLSFGMDANPLTLLSSGFVGVSTGAPQTTLDVNGNAQFGSGATKSTFSATGRLTFPTGYAPTVALEAANKGYVDSQVTSGSGWTDDGTSVRLTTLGDAVVVGNAATASSMTVTGAVGIGAMGLSAGTLVVRSTSTDATNPVVNIQNQGGTELLRVQQDGKVGIDTTNPGSPLEIGTNAAFTGRRLRLMGYATTAGTDANLEIGNGAGVYWRFARDGSNKFRMDLSDTLAIMGGNVGIGLTNPAETLQVNGSVGDSDGDMNLVNVDGFRFENTAGSSYVDSHGANTYFRAGAGAGETSYARTVMTFDNANGKVGIGVTNPTVPLQIVGVPTVDGDNRTSSDFSDSTAFAAGVGGGFSFSGKYNAAGALAGWAGLKGIKENATDGNYAGALVLNTRPAGGANTERLRITSDGNVGIGLSNPETVPTTLQVGGTNGRLVLSRATQAGGDNQLRYFTAGALSWALYQPTASSDLRIYDTGDRVTFQAGGNVGIGTTNPAAKLDLAGDAQFGSGALKSTFTAVPGAALFALTLSSGVSLDNGGPLRLTTNGYVEFPDGTRQTTASGAGSFVAKIGDTMTGQLTLAGSSMTIVNTNVGDSGDRFSLAVTTAPDRSVYHLYVTTHGSVGINSTAPQAKLAIVSNLDGPSEFAGLSVTNTVGTESRIRLRNLLAPTNQKTWQFAQDTSGGLDLELLNDNFSVNKSFRFSGDGYLGVGTTAPSAALHVSSGATSATEPIFIVSTGTAAGQELFRVQKDGKVGIGTTSPAAKLHVSSGTVLIDGDVSTPFRIGASTFAVIGSSVGIGTASPIQALHLKRDGDAAVLFEILNAVGASGSTTLNYTGALQTWVVPAGVTSVTVDAKGAAGGAGSAGDGAPGGAGGGGGLGGRVETTISVTPGETLNIYVGGAGGAGGGNGGAAGYNGGAVGGDSPSSVGGIGAGGGGASDVRQGGTALGNRVVVAGGGGGGGGGGEDSGVGGAGAAGGLATAANGANGTGTNEGWGGGGGTPSAGGAGGTGGGGNAGTVGALGNGGAGAAGTGGTCATNGSGGGGGGGGFYGGGGGEGHGFACVGGAGGAGGGSSYTSGSGTTHTAGFQAGNGQVVISYNSTPPNPANWTIGVDQSDGGFLKISSSTVPGTNDVVVITRDGLQINGSLSKQSGTFDIPHPDPEKAAEGWHLRHSFVESPTRGDNLYRYSLRAKKGENRVPLPDYFKHLNENPQVWVSPADHFGKAHGRVDEAQRFALVTVDSEGTYNVLVIGTRKDAYAREGFDSKGVEYRVMR